MKGKFIITIENYENNTLNGFTIDRNIIDGERQAREYAKRIAKEISDGTRTEFDAVIEKRAIDYELFGFRIHTSNGYISVKYNWVKVN